MIMISEDIPGYDYGSERIQHSKLTSNDLILLKESIRFSEEDAANLRIAGEVLKDQTQQIVELWRSKIIANIPNLARHSRAPDGEPLPEYLARTNLRFRQWILDTCMRPYDQSWIDYQEEIARRHSSLRKNQTDSVSSTEHVPFRDLIAFIAVMNETIRPFLTIKGHSEVEVNAMHLAWQKSLQLQIALWSRIFMDGHNRISEW